MVVRAALVWLGLLVLAVANGGIREGAITPRLGPYAGHLISTATLVVVIFGVAWLTSPWIDPRSARQAWAIGLLWTLATVAFELLGGHFLFGRPWPALFADYDLLHGRVWILVLLATLLAPVWAQRLGAVP